MADLSNSTSMPRRLFLASAPAAAFMLGRVQPPDPIFAAIARHKAAWDAFGIACAATDEVLAKQQGRKITPADIAADEAAVEVERQALEDMIEVVPQTAAGMRAAIAHMVYIERGCVPEMGGRFLTALLESPLLAA